MAYLPDELTATVVCSRVAPTAMVADWPDVPTATAADSRAVRSGTAVCSPVVLIGPAADCWAALTGWTMDAPNGRSNPLVVHRVSQTANATLPCSGVWDWRRGFHSSLGADRAASPNGSYVAQQTHRLSDSAAGCGS